MPPKLLNTNLRHACVSTGLPSVYMPGEVFRLSAGLTDCYAAAFYILLCYEFLSYTMYIALLFYEIFVNITSLFIFADSWKNIFAYEYLLRKLFSLSCCCLLLIFHRRRLRRLKKLMKAWTCAGPIVGCVYVFCIRNVCVIWTKTAGSILNGTNR